MFKVQRRYFAGGLIVSLGCIQMCILVIPFSNGLLYAPEYGERNIPGMLRYFVWKWVQFYA